MRESTFSFWEDTEFNALQDRFLTPADYSRPGHPEEEACWLLEANGNDGTRLVLMLALKGQEGQSRLILKLPEQEALVRDLTAPFRSAGDQFTLQVAGCRVSGAGEVFRLLWQEEGAELELEFRSLAPGWQPGHGRINYGEKGDQYFYWVVPVPRAAVNGNITAGGVTRAFAGTGYIDHRRYNFPLARNLAGGILGRYYAGDYTLIWADLQGNLLYSGKHITALYLARAGEILASTANLEVQVLEQKKYGELPYPAGVSLRAGTVPPARLDIQQVQALGPARATTQGARGLYVTFDGQIRLATFPETGLTGHGCLETLTV